MDAAASSLSAAVPDLGAVSLDADRYTNSCLKVSLRKPSYWQFVSVKAFKASLDDTQERLSRPELQQAVRELNEDDPILVIAKRSLRSNSLVPSIQLMTDPVSTEPAEFLEQAELGASMGAVFYEEYELERDFEIRKINSRDFGYFVATCSQTLDERRIACRMHFAVTMTEMAEFTLASAGPTHGRDECTAEFLSVLQSMTFRS